MTGTEERFGDALYAVAMGCAVGVGLWLLNPEPRPVWVVAGFIAINMYFGIRNGRSWAKRDR